MNIEKIKFGKITEQELVSLFGTDLQKKSYEEKGHFIGTQKKTLLTNIKKYCNIKDLGNRSYNITKIYEYPLPSNFPKMQKSLYKYICPLILNYLIDNNHSKHNRINTTINKLAKEINMVNQNYDLIKYNEKITAKEIQYPIDLIREFIQKTNNMLDYYIISALGYLKSADLIIYKEVDHINIEVSNMENFIIDENGKVSIQLHIESRRATKEDMEYYSDCIKTADKEANINNHTERYYSKKSDRFKKVLKRELYKKKIKCIYKTYEVYYTDLEKCKYILNQFQSRNKKTLIKKFNNEFTNLILENSSKRFNKFPNKYLYCSGEDDYVLCQKNLCEMTISNETEYLGDRIKKSEINDDYSLEITN